MEQEGLEQHTALPFLCLQLHRKVFTQGKENDKHDIGSEEGSLLYKKVNSI